MQCRCRRCGGRQTLARRLATYLRVPRCRHCGARDWREDLFRARCERGKAVTCYCHRQAIGGGLYWFPHRRGSKMCKDNPDLTMEVAEAWAQSRGSV